MVEDTTELTESQIDELAKALGQSQAGSDTKQSVHSFLFNVATAKDTRKLGFLREEEIGGADNTLRSFNVVGLFAREIMQNEDLARFFDARGEIITATSLSRAGFLIKQATLQKRQLEDVTKMPKENKGWFGKKKDTTTTDGGES